MRITDEMSFRLLTNSIASNRDRLYATQQQIASGLRIVRPSDNPVDYEQIARLQADSASLAQFQRNSNTLENELLRIDENLQRVSSIMQAASELAVQGGDATLTGTDRTALGQAAQTLLDELMAIANTSMGGRYRYAGLRSDTPPYTRTDSNGDGLPDVITYQGSRETNPIEIAAGIYLESNIPGSDLTGTQAVFQTRDIDLFTSIIQLRDRLLAGENTTASESFTADAGTDVLGVSGTFVAGCAVKLESNGTLPTGLQADTTYYAIPVPGGIQLAATLDDARNGVAIDLPDTGTGTHTIRSAMMGQIQDGLDHIASRISMNGARQALVKMNQDRLSQMESATLTARERIESVDVAKAMMELSKQQMAYEAALRAGSAMINQRTLVDYI